MPCVRHIPDLVLFNLPYGLRRRLFATLERELFDLWQRRRQIDTATGTSYRPFDQHRCIFIHVPKTAGISIAQALFGQIGGGHATIARYQIVFSKHDFNRYFKFAFVRNPWDRVFSAYNFLRKGGMNAKDAQWAAANLPRELTFESFVNMELSKPHILRARHFIPQFEYVCLPSRRKILIDYVGFYEHLQDDFRQVCRMLSLNSATSLGHANVSGGTRKVYMDHYTPEMRDVVARLYAPDIAHFGYNFDNSSLMEQIARRDAGSIASGHLHSTLDT